MMLILAAQSGVELGCSGALWGAMDENWLGEGAPDTLGRPRDPG